MSAARRYLDQIYSLQRLEAIEAGEYARLVADELPRATSFADLQARDEQLAGSLEQVDALTARAMRIRLDHVLAADTSLAAPTRNVFATTIVSYAGRLPLLAARVHDVATRGGAKDPDSVVSLVVAAARAVLDLREAMRAGLLELVRATAAASIADADRCARDRTLDDAARRRWSAMRRDLEALAADPAHIAAAPIASRLAALPEQLDEPEPEPEKTFADMIELD